MIILPNSLERYLASLRYWVSLSIQKHGAHKRHFANLKKIYLCEAILNKEALKSVNINKLTNNILNAAQNLNHGAKFKVDVKGNFLINKELYSFVLLKIFKNSSPTVFLKNNFLCIKFTGETEKLSTVISALNGYTLHETKIGQNIIAIPITKTHQASVYIESEWEYLFDSFSVVNLIFKS